MSKQLLHITNGTALTNYLNELNVKGEILTWQGMLCEGPTIENVNSEEFLNVRAGFFSSLYDVDLDIEGIINELDVLNYPENYTEINLWFEYDLFCHINMLAVIKLLQQKQINLPIYLICSGRVEGSSNLKGLGELSSKQLINHYKNKVKLTLEDLQLAVTLWGIYCGKDHNLFKPYIVQSSSFKYLSNCLKAHLERFPDSVSGLNIFERNILEIVKNNTIKSKHHLLGYALNYQGYYGFGDTQISRIIKKLCVFFNVEDDSLTLNRKGHEAILGQHNFSLEVDNNITFGGVNKFDFQFNKEENKLVKTVINAH